MTQTNKHLATDEKPTRCTASSVLFLSAVGGIYLKEARMLIMRKAGESLEQFKKRLVVEVEMDQMSAEDAFDCYEEAVFNDAEAV